MGCKAQSGKPFLQRKGSHIISSRDRVLSIRTKRDNFISIQKLIDKMFYFVICGNHKALNILFTFTQKTNWRVKEKSEIIMVLQNYLQRLLNN